MDEGRRHGPQRRTNDSALVDYRAILRECGIEPNELDAFQFVAITNALAKVHTAAHCAGYAYAINEGKD